MAEFFVYVLENSKGRLYIGHTDNLQRRLRQHNAPKGKSHLGKYTHKHGPWNLLGHESFPTRSRAMQREKELKAWKSPCRVRTLYTIP
ncbi:MAG: GIY-YIG nuclease family protein [Puniceicoccaceae bacterium]